MRIKTTLLATTAFAALALAVPAHAAGSWYVSVTGGGNWVDDTDFIIDPPTAPIFAWNTESDGGWLVAGAIGLDIGHVWSGLRADVELAYRENNADGVWTDNAAGTPETGSLDYDHQTFSVLANVWLDIPLGGFTPYIGGGIGWADVSAEGSYACFIGTCAATVTPFNFSEDGFAWQAGAGVNFPISPNMQIGLGYRFMQGPELTAFGLPGFSGLSHEVDNDNHSATATLIFNM